MRPRYQTQPLWSRGKTRYAVFNREKERVSRVFDTKAEAASRCAEIIDSDSWRDRACMCCGATFLSEGPHNRLCDDCRKKPADNWTF